MPAGRAALPNVIGPLISQVVEWERHRRKDEYRAQDKQFWAEGRERPFSHCKQRAAERKQDHRETARGDDGAVSIIVMPAAAPRTCLAASAVWAGFAHRHPSSHGVHKKIVAPAARSVTGQRSERTIGPIIGLSQAEKSVPLLLFSLERGSPIIDEQQHDERALKDDTHNSCCCPSFLMR
jgi:hypothetical protein